MNGDVAPPKSRFFAAASLIALTLLATHPGKAAALNCRHASQEALALSNSCGTATLYNEFGDSIPLCRRAVSLWDSLFLENGCQAFLAHRVSARGVSIAVGSYFRFQEGMALIHEGESYAASHGMPLRNSGIGAQEANRGVAMLKALDADVTVPQQFKAVVRQSLSSLAYGVPI